MAYKIIFSDIDGTLLSTKNNVSDFTTQQIQKIKNTIPFILISARMPKSMKYLQTALQIENEPIICYNGALIQHQGKTIFSETIPASVLEKIYETSLDYNINLGLYYDDEWYVEVDSERVQKEIFNTKAIPVFSPITNIINQWKSTAKEAHKIMCMGKEKNIDDIFAVLTANFKDVLHIYRSNATLIEIASKKVSKLSGIKKILETFYPFNIDEVVAFGDNYNDMEMIAEVGCGVAMGNARQEVKEIADKITTNNTDNGVAVFLKELYSL